jgi:AcrR family transcriptional regulator
MPRRRKYELRARAESQELTRQRIISAAMGLHEELGPARTSISAVAEKAGVQRVTVYRHFPDELSLLRACGGQYRSLHPPPDPERWRPFENPSERLIAGLRDLYAHFRKTRAMWGHVLRDAEVSDLVRQAAEPRFAYLRTVATALGTGWQKDVSRAVIAHAIQFWTWQSLDNGGISDELAARLMTRLAELAAREGNASGSSQAPRGRRPS